MKVKLDNKLFKTKSPYVYIYALSSTCIGISNINIKSWSCAAIFKRKSSFKVEDRNIVFPLPTPLFRFYSLIQRDVKINKSYSLHGDYALITVRRIYE